MGGAMDLATGAKKVIIAMEHCTRDGKPKILARCTLPLTAPKCVSMIVTELAVFRITGGSLVLEELGPGATLADVQQHTAAKFSTSEQLHEMNLGIAAS
jgi:acetate CoA/acetoacetate CoA-transferase beta subunit